MAFHGTTAIQQREMGMVAEYLGSTARDLTSKHDEMLRDVNAATANWVLGGGDGSAAWLDTNNVITKLIEELATYAVAYKQASENVAHDFSTADRAIANSMADGR